MSDLTTTGAGQKSAYRRMEESVDLAELQQPLTTDLDTELLTESAVFATLGETVVLARD